MSRILSLMLVFVFAFAVPLIAAEQHKLEFAWTYPTTQNNVINGFRIYKKLDVRGNKTLIMEVTNTSMRVATKMVVLNGEKTEFYVVPFIGTREGKPELVKTIKLTPFYPVTAFDVTCSTCGPQN